MTLLGIEVETFIAGACVALAIVLGVMAGRAARIERKDD